MSRPCVTPLTNTVNYQGCNISAAANQIIGILHIKYAYLYAFEAFAIAIFFLVLLYDSIKGIAAIFYQPLAEEIISG